ncbi:hypothetical protein BU15DRAFT_81177 [Melanogaster broomeanus]|nr:hypothetical protein BU15DRAFT_81177 [Melanogaster broomeanus]
METTSKSAVAEAQARIDDEVALLKLPICALLTRRNALSPVSPFTKILGILARWGAPPWANVSYICRHWRDVALNTSSLWSFLYLFPPRWTEELLSRSQTVPLRIRVTHGYWAQEEMDFLEKVTRDVTRIQDLSLALPYTLAEGVFAKLSASVPLLHTLRLFVKHIGTDAILIPDTLFNRETPPLRTLELRRCRIPWPSPIFTGLTTLGLRDIASSSGPTITEFLAMLRHIPDLAHLYLENALSGAEGILASQDSLLSDCLELPHLSRLAGAGRTLFGTSRYAVVVTFVMLSPTPHFIRFSNEDSAPYPTSGHTSECDCDVPFYSEYDRRRLHEDWGRGIPLKLDIEFESMALGDRERLMGDICRAIPMVHLRTLLHFGSIDMSDPLSSCFLKTTFGTLQELRFVRLIELDIDHWTAALSPGLCCEKFNVEDADNIFASALAELQVIDVAFGFRCLRRDLENCQGSAWCLRRALARRKATGYALKKLVIEVSSYVSEAQVEKLRTAVDELDWDGHIPSNISIASASNDGED